MGEDHLPGKSRHVGDVRTSIAASHSHMYFPYARLSLHGSYRGTHGDPQSMIETIETPWQF
jgi:hypothetical protein